MEGQGSNSVSKRPSKLSAFNVSPINVGSPLLRYLNCRSPSPASYQTPPSRSPLSSIENFQTPPSRSPPVFKMEEDVVVMDGVLVGSVPGGKAKSFSPRVKVSHGKEELHPPRISNKKRSEENAFAKVCTFSSPGSCSHGAKCPFVHHLASDSDSPAYVKAINRKSPLSPLPPGKEDLRRPRLSNKKSSDEKDKVCTFTSPGSPLPIVPKFSPMKLESSSKTYRKIDSSAITSSDWSPLDDGIDISLPSAASTEKGPPRAAVYDYIDEVLYGSSRRQRLPVFAEICAE